MEHSLQSGQDWDFIQVPGGGERPASEAVRVDGRKEREDPGSCSGREYGLSGSGVGWEEDLSGMNWDMSSDIESVDNSFLPLEKRPSLKSSYDTKKGGSMNYVYA